MTAFLLRDAFASIEVCISATAADCIDCGVDSTSQPVLLFAAEFQQAGFRAAQGLVAQESGAIAIIAQLSASRVPNLGAA